MMAAYKVTVDRGLQKNSADDSNTFEAERTRIDHFLDCSL